MRALVSVSSDEVSRILILTISIKAQMIV